MKGLGENALTAPEEITTKEMGWLGFVVKGGVLT
jgi:hypothetical protein